MPSSNISQLRKFVAPEYIYGTGARLLVSRYVKNFCMNKVMLVTDDGVQNAGWSKEIQDILGGDNIESLVFKDVVPNPRDYQVMRGAKIFAQEQCDGIVAVGGGSVMDCAKGIGIVVSNGQHITQFEGVDKVPIPAPPLICIPTTAGTSADVSQFCIITDTTRMVKIAIVSKMTIPDVALIDPETTSSMSESLTAVTGLDALTHAIEAYVSNAHSPMTDLHALDSIEKIVKFLPLAHAHPGNIEYRDKMMMASLNAGLAFSNASLGAVHAMAHSLGGLKDMPHGLCNTILLDKVIGFNFDAISKRYQSIAGKFKLKNSTPSSEQMKHELMLFLKDFKQQLQVDMTLSQHGLLENDIPQLAINASHDACIFTNPKQTSVKDIEHIYEQSF